MNWGFFWLFVIIAGVIALGVVAVKADNEEVKECQQRGGIRHCNSGTGLDSKGRVIVTSMCDCYKPDGTLLLNTSEAQ